MSGHVLAGIKSLTRLAQGQLSLLNLVKNSSVILSQRNRHTKHWNPKWKKLRAEKVIKVKLIKEEDEKDDTDMTPEKMRSKMKELGLKPSKPWIERPMHISCTGGIFEAYVPPEGDGKSSLLSTDRAKQTAEFMTKKGKSFWATKKIKQFEDEFNFGDFEEEAQEIYLKSHEALANKDEEALRSLMTERAYPEAMHNIANKTIRWKFIESLNLPRTVHVRQTDVITKTNVFAQITVRFNTRQTLAVYDRFGRLMHGSEIVAKDVLEYVVFEKHLSNKYGLWRIHAKIIPSWMPPREFGVRTFVDKEPKAPKEPSSEKEEAVAEVVPAAPPSSSPQNTPQPGLV